MKPLIEQNTQLNEPEDASGFQDDWQHPAHGGNLTAVSEAMGKKPTDFLDFSVNVNPLGPPDCVKEFCFQSLSLLQEYPDPDYGELKQALSDANGVPADWIMVGNGSTELIYLLPHLIGRGKEILIVSPCFSEYERAFRRAGITVKHFHLDPADGFALPIDKLLFHLRQNSDCGGIVIGHPNSPTGTLVESESFGTLSRYCEKQRIFLFVDETFIDFSGPDQSFLKHLPSNPNLVLVRSMTKFFSLPGLRLGYGIMHPKQAKLIVAHQPPWSVNALAQAIGPALTRTGDFPETTRTFINREYDFLYEQMNKMPAIGVYPSQANFLLFRLLDRKKHGAKRFFDYLINKDIVLRNCGNFKGLNVSFFRLAIRNRIDNQRLVSCMQEFFQLNGD